MHLNLEKGDGGHKRYLCGPMGHATSLPRIGVDLLESMAAGDYEATIK